MFLPAHGKIVQRFGQISGTQNQGVILETRPDAQVISPHDGWIVYAGPFRGYGLLLIIEHGEGYHSLLTGFSKLDSVPGQWVLAGEPVGLMGAPKSGRPRLYIELRHNGQPINPLPWLIAKKG